MKAAVSVIIPCYRCADTLYRAIDSVVKQTLLPQEIILIDDFSDDDRKTLNVILDIQSRVTEVDIKIIQLDQNSGPASARNSGWGLSKQPYIAFLDADDSWHYQKIEMQYNWMLEHPEVSLTGHQSIFFSPETVFPNKFEVKQVKKHWLLLQNCLPTRSVMLKSDIIFRFSPGKYYAEDYLLWLSIVMSGQKVCVFNYPLAYIYKEEFGAGGLTANLWKSQQGVIDTYKKIYLLGLISLPIFILITGVSWGKYLRRWLTVKWRKE